MILKRNSEGGIICLLGQLFGEQPLSRLYKIDDREYVLSTCWDVIMDYD